MKQILQMGAASFLLITFYARADGTERTDWTAQPQEPKSTSSAASLDKRLPPVLPGEEISTGKKTIKVWSTAGSPSVGAPQLQQQPPARDVSVIVDGRNDDHKRAEHPHILNSNK